MHPLLDCMVFLGGCFFNWAESRLLILAVSNSDGSALPVSVCALFFSLIQRLLYTQDTRDIDGWELISTTEVLHCLEGENRNGCVHDTFRNEQICQEKEKGKKNNKKRLFLRHGVYSQGLGNWWRDSYGHLRQDAWQFIRDTLFSTFLAHVYILMYFLRHRPPELEALCLMSFLSVVEWKTRETMRSRRKRNHIKSYMPRVLKSL